jgi:hypothetical protein
LIKKLGPGPEGGAQKTLSNSGLNEESIESGAEIDLAELETTIIQPASPEVACGPDGAWKKVRPPPAFFSLCRKSAKIVLKWLPVARMSHGCRRQRVQKTYDLTAEGGRF